MTTATAHDPSAKEALWRRRTHWLYGLTLLSVAVNVAMSRPDSLAAGAAITAGMALWLIQTLPLWLFFPAIRRRNTRGLSWFGYVLLLYLVFAIAGGATPPIWSAALVSVSTLGLFFANAWWVRALKKVRRGG